MSPLYLHIMKLLTGRPATIRIPTGESVTIKAYVDAWRLLKAANPCTLVKGWTDSAEPVDDILEHISFGVHDRINHKIPGWGQGRKWSDQWWWDTWRAARDLNTPRLAIHWLAPWLRERFAHRISSQ